MTSDDTLNRFDDFLDGRRATGDGRQATGVDPSLADAVRRLHALDARDREPEPRPQFLSRLQEDLMNQALAMPVRRTEYRVPSTAHPPSAFRHPPSALPRRRLWPNLAAAAIILLTIGAGILAYRLAPNGADDTPTLPAAAQDTPAANPTADGIMVDIAECATERRPDGAVAALASESAVIESLLPPYSTPGPDAQLDKASFLAGWPEGDRSTYDAVSDTVRQLTACRFYATPLGRPEDQAAPDLDGQYFAHYSDDYFRRELDADGNLPAYWTPAGPTERAVETARQLPDGRVLVLLTSVPETVPQDRTLGIFINQGNQWLVDEIAPLASTGENRVLEVVVWDDGAVIWPNPTQTTFAANEHLIITLANLGEQPHQIRSDSLGAGAQAQPGQSEVFIIAPAAGTYDISTAVIDEDGQALQMLTAELTFVWQGHSTPAPPQG